MFFNDNLLTIKEVSQALKVSNRTVYRWVDSGELKTAKIGRKTYRVFESDLKKFVKKFIK